MSNAFKRAAVALGFAEEDEALTNEIVRDEAPIADMEPAGGSHRAEPPANVTPLRPAPQRVGEMHEILTVHPRQYKDAKEIAAAFRDEVPVIINLSQMTDGDARRLIDFSAGLTQGLLGKIERVTAKVYLLTPHSVTVTGSHQGGEEGETNFFSH